YLFEYRVADTVPTEEPRYPDNERFIVVEVGPGTFETVTVAFDEDDPNGYVEYRLRLGPESDLFFPEWTRVDVNTDCEKSPVSNPGIAKAYDCGKVTITFTNDVEPGEWEIAVDAVFTLNGEE